MNRSKKAILAKAEALRKRGGLKGDTGKRVEQLRKELLESSIKAKRNEKS